MIIELSMVIYMLIWIFFKITEENAYGQEGEIIGYAYNFTISELNSLSGNLRKLELEFVLESDEKKN